jgi:hypothetical protein
VIARDVSSAFQCAGLSLRYDFHRDSVGIKKFLSDDALLGDSNGSSDTAITMLSFEHGPDDGHYIQCVECWQGSRVLQQHAPVCAASLTSATT